MPAANQRPPCPFAAGRSQRATAAAAADSDPSTSGSRGVLILPGLGNGSGDYSDLTALIQKRGMQTAVAPVGRLDWGRNAAAIADINWWKGTLKPRPAVDWCALQCISISWQAWMQHRLWQRTCDGTCNPCLTRVAVELRRLNACLSGIGTG